MSYVETYQPLGVNSQAWATQPQDIELGAFMRDAFVDTDGTLLSAHVGERGVWQQMTGTGTPTATISLVATAAGYHSAIGFGAGHGTYASSMPASSADYSVFGVLKFLTDNNGYIHLAIRCDLVGSVAGSQCYGFGYDCFTNTWRIVIQGSAVVTAIGNSVAATLTAGQSYTLELRAQGSLLQGWVDGVLICQATNTVIPGPGTPGIMIGNAATATTGVHLTAIWATDGFVAQSLSRDIAIAHNGDSLTAEYYNRWTK